MARNCANCRHRRRSRMMSELGIDEKCMLAGGTAPCETGDGDAKLKKKKKKKKESSKKDSSKPSKKRDKKDGKKKKGKKEKRK